MTSAPRLTAPCQPAEGAPFQARPGRAPLIGPYRRRPLTGPRVAGVDPPSPPPVTGPGIDVRARLRLALTDALRARDIIAVSALRSALSAIGNAEAVDAEAVDPGGAAAPGAAPAHAPGSPYVAGRGRGSGRHGGAAAQPEHGRDRADRAGEAGERQRTAREYERAGHAGQADRLRREARVLMSVVAGGDRPGDEAAPTSGEQSGPPPGLA